MRTFLKTYIRRIMKMCGLRSDSYPKVPPDFDELHVRIFGAVRHYTLTSPERVYALIEAVKFIVRHKVEGSMVECGVWKGGSAMAMALTLIELGDNEREIYLYDTFSGMSAPSEMDISIDGCLAQDKFSATNISKETSSWYYSSLEEVTENVFSTGYPKDKFHFIKGKVEDTLPKNIPKNIALLRLDTDWYESTKHELTHLFPRLSHHGVVIIDDYAYWEGCRKAVDEYISEHNLRILLHRIDSPARFAIKL